MNGLQLDNYAGVHSVYLNPSAIASSHWKAHLNIGFGSFQASQNRLSLETVLFSGKSYKIDNTKYGVIQNELRGPGVMVQLRNNHAFAITTRYRSAQSFSGNYQVLDWLRGDVKELTDLAGSINLKNEAFSEYAVSYAAPVYEKDKHFLKAGATFKLLYGLQTASIQTAGSFQPGTSGTAIYNATGFQGYHSDFAFTSDLKIAEVLKGSTPGKGNGIDIGVTYEYRPHAEANQYLLNGKNRFDPSVPNYLVKAGISVTDIGKINYNKTTSYAATALSGNLDPLAYQGLKSSHDFYNQFVNDLSLEGKAKEGKITVKLPQVITVQADVNLGRGLFVGGAWIIPKTRSIENLRTSSVISIGPRYEKNDFGFSLTGQYYGTFKKAAIGTNLRLGIVTLGTDNLLGFFTKNGLNPHVYAGFFIPLGKWTREKDDDQDNVSNRLDQCRDIPGLWVFKGCPDTDGDGIEDRYDKCPEEAGPKETNGCPDSDKDGIFDKNDACPHEPGLARFNGCPDTDNDGVPNHEDECPQLAGAPELGGCPDTDKDGIKDNQDKCKDAAGLKELDGCPLINLTQNLEQSADKELTARIAKALESSPILSEDLKSDVNAWLAKYPNGSAKLTFSGTDREMILRIAGYYKDELTAQVGNRITAAVAITQAGTVGLKTELVR